MTPPKETVKYNAHHTAEFPLPPQSYSSDNKHKTKRKPNLYIWSDASQNQTQQFMLVAPTAK